MYHKIKMNKRGIISKIGILAYLNLILFKNVTLRNARIICDISEIPIADFIKSIE